MFHEFHKKKIFKECVNHIHFVGGEMGDNKTMSLNHTKLLCICARVGVAMSVLARHRQTTG